MVLPLAVLLLCKIALAILECVCVCVCVCVFPHKVEGCFFNFCEFLCIFLMRIALNLKIDFCRRAIFRILILPIHELGRSFYLLVSSSISFFMVLRFLLYKSFTCLVSVIPRYFFEAFVKGVAFLILFSVSLSFIYSSTTDFCKLIWHRNLLTSLEMEAESEEKLHR